MNLLSNTGNRNLLTLKPILLHPADQIRSDPKINSFVEELLIIFIKYPQIVSTIMTRILCRVTIGEFVATGCGQSKKKAKHSAAKVGTLMISYHQFNYMNPSLMCLLSTRKNKR